MHNHIKHLVIDEMQDYSYLQYVILNQIFKCRMTILGDKAQTLDEQMRDVLQFLPGVFDQKIRKIVMNKSYRNTMEIARYAEKLTGVKDVELLKRHGKEVVEEQFQTEDAVLDEILSKAKLGEDEYETAAIITMTEAEASTLYQILKSPRRRSALYRPQQFRIQKRTYRHDLLSCKRSGIRPGIRCVPGCRKPRC